MSGVRMQVDVWNILVRQIRVVHITVRHVCVRVRMNHGIGVCGVVVNPRVLMCRVVKWPIRMRYVYMIHVLMVRLLW